jgi:hypothetical protein
MNKPDRIFKNHQTVFLKSVIYPEQFNKNESKLLYHIVNVCYTLLGIKRLKIVVKMYCPDYNPTTLESVLAKYDVHSDSLFRYDCFTHIRDVLVDEDMYFTRSGKKRVVTLNEYKFLLQRITRNLYLSPGCKSVMVNKFFHTMKADYRKYSAKTLDDHKLAYILQVLQKHKYLHITYNSKYQRVVQIGPANPYYQLTKVPDLDKAEIQDVSTKTDREINQLRSDVRLLKEIRVENEATIQSLREENAQLKEDAETAIRIKDQYETYMLQNYVVTPQIKEEHYANNGEHHYESDDPYHSGRHFLN